MRNAFPAVKNSRFLIIPRRDLARNHTGRQATGQHRNNPGAFRFKTICLENKQTGDGRDFPDVDQKRPEMFAETIDLRPLFGKRRICRLVVPSATQGLDQTNLGGKLLSLDLRNRPFVIERRGL